MTGKELINEIESKIAWNDMNIDETSISLRDVKRLLNELEKQTERVQELEETVEDYKTVNKELHQRGRKVRKQIKRYREALEFYADEEHYKEKLISEAQYDADGICISNDEYAPPIIYFDSGEIARQALEGEE